MRHPPEKTPELFERYSPYAMALGVEDAWARKFTDVFSGLEASEQDPYRPAWYVGPFHSSNLGSFTDNVVSNFSSAISSAAVPNWGLKTARSLISA